MIKQNTGTHLNRMGFCTLKDLAMIKLDSKISTGVGRFCTLKDLAMIKQR